MSEINQSAAPEAASPSELPSDQSSSPAAPVEAKTAELLQEKKESGEKLSPKEEKKLKEYNLKVNGKNKVIKFDPSNDEEVLSYLQKAEASDSKFQEAAAVRKAAIQFIDDLKKNPRKVLSDPNIGVDLKKFAEEIMNETLQEMEKSPEQREREKLQKELEALRKEKEDEKKSWEEKEFTRMQAEHEKQLETDISAALDIGGLPKTPRTVKAMAEMMMIALENGIDLSPADIAPIVKNTTLTEFKEVVGSLSDDQLEDFLGKEILGRLRKKNVAKAKAVETASAVKSTGNEIVAEKKDREEDKNKKKVGYRDFFGF